MGTSDKPQNDIRESSRRTEGLGENWSRKLSEFAELEPPTKVSDEGSLALLCTNEFFDPEEIQSRTGPLNGYICGVGFGNILSLMTLYKEGTLPKAILSIDLMPQVVLVGRVTIELLKQSHDFISFMEAIKSKDKFNEVSKLVISLEKSSTIKSRLEEVDIDKTMEKISHESDYIPDTGYVDSSLRERISVLGVIRERFDDFRKLAMEGNIAISLGNATNQGIINTFNELPNFRNGNNLVYLSNIIDHITERGIEFGTDYNLLSALQPYSILNHGASVFLDTTAARDYKLRTSRFPPIYSLVDFKVGTSKSLRETFKSK